MQTLHLIYLHPTSIRLQLSLIKVLQDRTEKHTDKLWGTWLTVAPPYLGLDKCLQENMLGSPGSKGTEQRDRLHEKLTGLYADLSFPLKERA